MLWLLWKVSLNWVVYHKIQKVESLWNSMQRVLGPIRRIRFTQSTLRHASIREKEGPSLGTINVKVPHHPSPYAMKFEDRSREETEGQLRCARSKAWNLSKNIYRLKKKQSCILLSRGGMGTPGCVNKRVRGKTVCGGFRSEYAYGQ